MKKEAIFYYDVISPYAYLFVKMRDRLEEKLSLKPVPIFFPGLLRAQNNVGPAEVPEKRIHTYNFCTWKAAQEGIPFKFPKRHPFSSVAAMRLLYAHQANWDMVEKAFNFIWQEGKEPETDWHGFCGALGLSSDTPKPTDENIKTGLAKNTQIAGSSGVFGVPSVVIDGKVFWGCDTIEWINEFVENPNLFNEDPYKLILQIENPLLNSN